MVASDNLNPQQFYHGTRFTFTPGQELTPQGRNKNYSQSTGEHVYMTSDIEHAHKFAANGEYGDKDDRPHIYQVTPIGHFEEDPYDKAPSYRAKNLKVVGEVQRNWTPEEYAQSEWN